MQQLLFNVFIATSFYVLLSLSFTRIYFCTKNILISTAALISSAPYVTYKLANNNIYFAPSIVLISIFFAVILGTFFELLIYTPLRKKNNNPSIILILSLSIYIILQNLISLYFGDDAKTLNTGEITIGHQLFGAYITTVQIITIIVATLVFAGMYFLYNYTTLGKQIRAVSENEALATIYGISSNKVILIVTAISSALAAIAGILYAYDTNLTPTMGFNLLLYGIVAMIIGGVGSFRGLLLGSLLLATTQNVVAYYLDTKWMDAATYIILIIFLLWKPLGFSGKKLKKVEI